MAKFESCEQYTSDWMVFWLETEVGRWYIDLETSSRMGNWPSYRLTSFPGAVVQLVIHEWTENKMAFMHGYPRSCVMWKRGHKWCLTLTPNNTQTIERMTCHCFLRPIRRDLTSSSYTTGVSEDEIAENFFLTKTERNESKNTQNKLLNKCYLLFKVYLQEKTCGYILTLCRKIGHSWEQSLRGGIRLRGLKDILN